nr:hypothetical protein [Tanacetum cinerariifolium]
MINQTDLKNCNSVKAEKINRIKNEHLYSASANEIDGKKPELKDLPPYLEYAYQHSNEYFPLIVSSKLFEKEKKSLLQVLEKHKGAITWNMSAIKWISPSFCTHKILMEDDFRPFIQPQMYLNPKVKNVIPIALEDQDKIMITCPYGTLAYMRMPFGLCNMPAPFQLCMTAIFHDMVEDLIEVFMDDFSVLKYLFNKQDDKPRLNMKGVRSFLGHAGFYRRFIKEFSMISKPMTQLLLRDAQFDLFDDCKKAFNVLKEKLTTALIKISPDWNVPFELMCDASDFAIGAVLGQQIDGKFKPIYYAIKTLNDAQ